MKFAANIYTASFIACLVLSENVFAVLTEKQIKSTGKLMRNSCQPKNKATDEDIDKMHSGDWNVDKTAKCYMYCIATMMKLVAKSGDLDTESAVKQIATLPEKRHAPTLKSVEKCKHEGDNVSDKCEKAHLTFKCVYFDNPDNYFLP